MRFKNDPFSTDGEYSDFLSFRKANALRQHDNAILNAALDNHDYSVEGELLTMHNIRTCVGGTGGNVEELGRPI